MTDQEKTDLEKLIGAYDEALRLERELAQMLENGDLGGVPANTRAKKALMPQIEAQFSSLDSILEEPEKADSASRPQIEQIRAKIKLILELEESNNQAISEMHAEVTSDVEQNRVARKFARGYRPTGKEAGQSKLDEKG